MSISIPRYEDADLPGLPEKAWVITNSERNAAACPKRHWFAYSEGLSPKETASVLRMGTAWHSIKEAVLRYWMEHDETAPSDIVNNELKKYGASLVDAYSNGEFDEDELQSQYVRVERAADGWIKSGGLTPYKFFKVVAVEHPLAAQVVNPKTGKPLRVSGYVVPCDEGGLRLARTGELAGASLVRWPYYQVGRIDAVIAHRKTGAIWAVDHKFTGSPNSYIKSAMYDPQLPGYCWMLQENIRAGRLPGVSPDQSVVGFMYEITSSQKQQDPKMLKNGELSRAKSARVPSWRYLDKIEELGLCKDYYQDYVLDLIDRVDPTLYKTEWLTITDEDHLKYKREIYGESMRISSLKRAAVRASSYGDIFTTHPRVPVCKLPGGTCSFKVPCFVDGVESRSFYDVKNGVRWCSSGVPRK